MNKIKYIVLGLTMLFILTGCDSRKCLESHKEKSICQRLQCNYSLVTKTSRCIPINYSCTKTICDEYEKEPIN